MVFYIIIKFSLIIYLGLLSAYGKEDTNMDDLPRQLPKDSDDRLLRLMRLTYSKVQRPFEELFKGQLTALQLHVLCELKISGAMTVTELADRLRIPKQQMSKLVSKMALSGYIVKKRTVSTDKRSVMVEITEGISQMMSSKCIDYMETIGRTMEESGVDRVQFAAAVRLLADILDRMDEHHIPPKNNG